MQETLTEALASFPNATHVQTVCKVGPDQCGYLVERAGKYSCLRYGLDAGPAPSTPALCEGILGKLKDKAELLAGQHVTFLKPQQPGTLELKGTLANIQIEGEQVHFDIDIGSMPSLYLDYERPIIGLCGDLVRFVPRDKTFMFDQSEKIILRLPNVPLKSPEPAQLPSLSSFGAKLGRMIGRS